MTRTSSRFFEAFKTWRFFLESAHDTIDVIVDHKALEYALLRRPLLVAKCADLKISQLLIW